VLCALACLSAPAAQAEEWFDAYEAGLRLLRQGQGVKAAERFERAIRLRPEPGRNILTYGTNRLASYHPYLRLAEAWLLVGDAARARDALARSETRPGEPADESARLHARVRELETRVADAHPTPAPSAPPSAPPTPIAALSTPSPEPAATPATPPSAAALPTAPLGGVPSPAAALGTLELRSEPAGASVWVGDRLVGTTPLAIELPPGRHEVTLRKTGSADQRFAVRIDAGGRTRESRSLLLATGPSPIPDEAPPAGQAALIVYSQPPGANVYIDDEPLGRTDPATGRFVKTGLSPGRHHLRLSAPGHDDLTLALDLPANQPSTRQATLTPVAASGAGWPVATVVALVALAALAVIVRRRRQGVPSPAAGHSHDDLPDRPTLVQARGATPRPTRVTPVGRATPGATAIPHVTASSDPTDKIATHALLELVDAATPSELFGEYRLLELLGKGGMASVHRAERHGEFFALKRPLSSFLDEPEFLQRFSREADIGRTLHHPNIVRIVDRGSVGPVPYFTMELVAGETLHAYLRRHGRLAAPVATRLVLQVAEALDYAHLKGVVHRDLKPSNVMVLPDGGVKVMDYGIARARRFDGLTVTGHFLGTPDYVAPETAEGRSTDARSDLYALGIVFYELLAGRRPFVADTPFALLRLHCSEPPTPPTRHAPDCPPEIEAVVLKLMAKDPDERHANAEELLIELRDYLNRAA
jgi:hypothetical protein